MGQVHQRAGLGVEGAQQGLGELAAPERQARQVEAWGHFPGLLGMQKGQCITLSLQSNRHHHRQPAPMPDGEAAQAPAQKSFRPCGTAHQGRNCQGSEQ